MKGFNFFWRYWSFVATNHEHHDAQTSSYKPQSFSWHTGFSQQDSKCSRFANMLITSERLSDLQLGDEKVTNWIAWSLNIVVSRILVTKLPCGSGKAIYFLGNHIPYRSNSSLKLVMVSWNLNTMPHPNRLLMCGDWIPRGWRLRIPSPHVLDAVVHAQAQNPQGRTRNW